MAALDADRYLEHVDAEVGSARRTVHA
jgi:hypothetical protein